MSAAVTTLTKKAIAGAMHLRQFRPNLTPQQRKYLMIGAGVAAAAVAAVVLVPKAMGAQVGSISLKVASGATQGIAPFDVHFTGKVLDTSDNPIPNFHLNLFVNDKSVLSTTTDKSGAFAFDPEFAQGGTFTCYAAPSALSAVKSSPVTITVQGPSSGATLTTITISASRTSVLVGEYVTLSGRALDQNGSGVTGKTLYLFQNGTTKVASTQTAADGGYSFSLSFPQAGTFALDVSDSTSNI